MMNKKILLIILTICIIFICVNNKETFNNNYNKIGSKGKLILYYADWCSACQNFMPDWDSIEYKYSNIIDFVKIEEKKIPKKIMKTLTKYPTIMYNDYIQKKTREIHNINGLLEEITK